MHLARKNCSRDCIDGCRCPDGQALDEANKCIAIDSCPREYKMNTFDCAPINNKIESKDMWYVRDSLIFLEWIEYE